VQSTVVGYSGSKNPQDTPNPTYQNILDYAESIRVEFDPDVVDYSELLHMFFQFHTPADPRWCGTQYRSAIFVHTEEQRRLAERALRMRGKAMAEMVAVEDGSDFYRAEEYHQKYLDKMLM